MSSSSLPKTVVVFLIWAILGCGVVGCPAGPTFVVQQYAGAQRPRESIATLRVNGSQSTRLLVLDGQDVAAPVVSDGRLHIEILPGRHTIVVANADDPNERYAPISFPAEAGKVYRVVFGPGGVGAGIVEVDRDSDKILTEAIVAREPVPASAPPAPVPLPPVTAADAGE